MGTVGFVPLCLVNVCSSGCGVTPNPVADVVPGLSPPTTALVLADVVNLLVEDTEAALGFVVGFHVVQTNPAMLVAIPRGMQRTQAETS